MQNHYSVPRIHSWSFRDLSLAKGIAKAQSTLSLWLQRDRSRGSLSQLEDWQLEDVGLTREQAKTEANKMFWQD